MTQAVGGVRSVVLAMWVALFVASVSGRGSRDSSGEFYTDWDLAGGCSSTEGGAGRPSGAGGVVDICADVGRYDWIWVTYAGAWCIASGRQAPQIRAFATLTAPRVKVYTVLTSGIEPFVGATERDARAWAGTHRLPASHVLAEQSARVIPVQPEPKTLIDEEKPAMDGVRVRGVMEPRGFSRIEFCDGKSLDIAHDPAVERFLIEAQLYKKTIEIKWNRSHRWTADYA